MNNQDPVAAIRRPSKRFNGFWLITIAAAYALVVTDRSPFMTGVAAFVTICGTALCLMEQRQD